MFVEEIWRRYEEGGLGGLRAIWRVKGGFVEEIWRRYEEGGYEG